MTSATSSTSSTSSTSTSYFAPLNSNSSTELTCAMIGSMSLTKRDEDAIQYDINLTKMAGQGNIIDIAEFTPSPYPCPPLYTAEERLMKCKSLLQTEKGTISQGFCQLVVLFDDYLDDCIRRCISSFKKGSSKIQDPENQLVLFQTSARIKRHLGALMGVLAGQQEGLFFVSSIDIFRKTFVIEYHDIIKEINSLPEENHAVSDLLSGFMLLKDFICHDLRALSYYEKKDNLTQNFDRVLLRMKRLYFICNNLITHCSSVPQFSYNLKEDAEIPILWERDKNDIFKFCTDLEQLIRQYNTTYSPEILSKILVHIYNKDSFDKGSLSSKLIEEKDKEALFLILENVLVSFHTIKDQCRLAILHHLIENKYLNTSQLRKFLSDYEKCIRYMQKYNSNEDLYSQSLSLINSQLTEGEQVIISYINDSYGDIFTGGRSFLLEFKKLMLNTSIKHFKSANSNGAIAVSLQPSINNMYSSISVSSLNIKQFYQLKNCHFNNKKISEEAKQLFLMAESILESQFHAVSAPLSYIENLFKQAFKKYGESFALDVQKKEKLAAEKQEELLKELNKKKEKRPNQHSNVQIAPPNPINSVETKKPSIKSAENQTSSQPVALRKKRKKQAKIQAKIQEGEEMAQFQKQIPEFLVYVLALPVAGPDVSFREKWRNNALNNAKVVFSYFEESSEIQEFSRDKIFTETNLMRQLLEGVLETALAHFAVLNADETSILHQVNSHELHKLVKQLLSGKAIPENIRKIVFASRSTAYALSQANACVNYLYSTAEKEHLPEQAKNLVKYLISVDEQFSIENPNRGTYMSLLQTHQKLVKESLKLSTELLKGILNPEYELNQGPGEFLEEIIDSIDIEPVTVDRFKETASELAANRTKKDIAVPLIRNRVEALQAIQQAKQWILIRIISSVEGEQDFDYRVEKRNLALKNGFLYLEQLEEKLKRAKFEPYNLSFGVLGLLRRLHKELCISMFYHGAYFEENKHIVESQQLRYINDPCYLHGLVSDYAGWPEELAKAEEILWMKEAHQVLSYPNPLGEEYNQDFLDLVIIIKEVRKIVDDRKENAKMKAFVEPGFTLVGTSGSKISPDKEELKIEEREQKLRVTLEEKIFSSLYKIGMILRFGFAQHPQIED